jgi:hypothetical protein
MMRRLRLLPAILVATAVALAVAALAALAPLSPLVSVCAGAGPNHAALVVEHGDGSAVTRCVAFDTASVSGEQLLNLSGVAWSSESFGSFGEAVCAVDVEPAHYSTCPGKDSYWAVFVARGGGPWQLTSIGVSTLTLGDGDAEGLRYVPAVGSPAAPPSPVGVCGAAGATATVAATVTAPIATPVAAGATGTASSGATVGPSAATAATSAAGSVTPGVAGATTQASGGASPVAYVAAGDPSTAIGAAPDAPLGGGSGIDFGLLAAALTGGALGGLALLKLSAAGRRPS